MTKIYNIEELMELSGVKFGTSGARGLADKMTDEVCYAYTVAFLQHLEESNNIDPACQVAIAGDLRPSSPRICAAVAKAIEDKGYSPLYCGEIPAPAIAYYGILNSIPSVMVTGSHIPDDRNGIKYNTPVGEILKEDEQGIRRQNVSIPEGLCKENGFFSTAYELEKPYQAAEDIYIQRYTDFYDEQALAGLNLGVYEHSAVGRDTLKRIYSALGANVRGLGRSTKFIPVDTEAIRPEDCELALDWCKNGGYDALLSTDGDSDRPLISDEKGHWLRGDVAGILTAQHLGADVVATPVSCNSAVELCQSFKKVSRTQIGSPYVIASMKEASASGGKMVVGYEANGGFLTNSALVEEGKALAALPTRDAVILHISILLEAKKRGLSVSGLVKTLPERYTISNRIKEFPTEQSKAKLATFVESKFADNANKIEAVFGELCGAVEAIDTTDGIRISFENLEIIHLRPSGNAPELRCYNEASSEKRALELNELCIEIMSDWR
ncbi:phosphomannomutase [Lentisphaera profundi]|uniref:Phosphomannomutase n=1 Tax=Lentisphaera profundi TaxID=1658616 RepID=A0ABY7VXK1_9BACT|nr:phosphomannomutase [Lentisphaera profundi]WDE97587.1 phosphomannomutase [Lentisphaera profundi]